MDKVRQRLSVRKKTGKTSIHFILLFARVTQLYLTTHTTESIICLLQQHLILTAPAKKFHEIWIHDTMNCTAEAESCGVFLWVTSVWKGSEHAGSWGILWGYLHLAATRCRSQDSTRAETKPLGSNSQMSYSWNNAWMFCCSDVDEEDTMHRYQFKSNLYSRWQTGVSFQLHFLPAVDLNKAATVIRRKWKKPAGWRPPLHSVGHLNHNSLTVLRHIKCASHLKLLCF